MRGDQARKVCPNVQLVQVPTAHGKADLTLYRDAGKLVCTFPLLMAILLLQEPDFCHQHTDVSTFALHQLTHDDSDMTIQQMLTDVQQVSRLHPVPHQWLPSVICVTLQHIPHIALSFCLELLW